VIVGLIITFQALQRVKPARRFFDGIYLRTTFFSGLFKGYELALISQLLSTLVKGGLSINEALGVAAEAATNVCYEDSLVVIQDRVAKGVTISEAMREYPQLYPVNMVVIIAAAEKSGSLEESLAHLAEFYSKEVDNKTKSLPTVLEPLMLIFIGLIVSLIALSIISPIYDLVQSLQK
jgi:type IV pilus assembly protein PilC